MSTRECPLARLRVAKSGAGGKHWRGSCVDGLDDFAVVDALQVDGRDAEVGVAELALDDVERNALAGHLDGVRVAELCGAKRRRTPARRAGPECPPCLIAITQIPGTRVGELKRSAR